MVQRWPCAVPEGWSVGRVVGRSRMISRRSRAVPEWRPVDCVIERLRMVQ